MNYDDINYDYFMKEVANTIFAGLDVGDELLKDYVVFNTLPGGTKLYKLYMNSDAKSAFIYNCIRLNKDLYNNELEQKQIQQLKEFYDYLAQDLKIKVIYFPQTLAYYLDGKEIKQEAVLAYSRAVDANLFNFKELHIPDGTKSIVLYGVLVTYNNDINDYVYIVRFRPMEQELL